MESAAEAWILLVVVREKALISVPFTSYLSLATDLELLRYHSFAWYILSSNGLRLLVRLIFILHPATRHLIFIVHEIILRPFRRRKVNGGPIREDDGPRRLGLLETLPEKVLPLLEIESPHGGANPVGDAEEKTDDGYCTRKN